MQGIYTAVHKTYSPISDETARLTFFISLLADNHICIVFVPDKKPSFLYTYSQDGAIDQITLYLSEVSW